MTAAKTSLTTTGSIYKPSFALNSTVQKEKDKVVRLTVIDARSKTAAAANMIKGGGYENEDLYDGVRIKFMDIGNIHGIFALNRFTVNLLFSVGPQRCVLLMRATWTGW